MISSRNFAVNGRFLTQSVTGVQRYALNVIGSLNDVLHDTQSLVPIVAPRQVLDPKLGHIPLVRLGPLSGHAWEQVVLPALWTGEILNLCNTAPAVKSKQIVCIHDANVFIRPESYGWGFRAFYQTLQPLLARNAGQIVTVSQDSAFQIAKYLPISASKIAVLPNGHEHALAWNPALARVAPSILADRFPGSHRPFVLAIGSLAEHKNMKLIIDIAPRLSESNIDVIIIGGSEKIFTSAGLNAESNVLFTGRIDDNELAFFMSRALCLLFPSWTEGFGLPIVESMARGCPVISSDRASMPEVCGDAAIMASPEDRSAWIKHINNLATSAAMREDFIQKGHERVKLFSWRKTAEAYVNLMQ